MKFVSALVAASLVLSPVLATAQGAGGQGNNQYIGVPPQTPVPKLSPIPEGVAAGAVIGLLVIGAGVGIGLGSGGGGNGTTGTTSTTSTTTTH